MAKDNTREPIEEQAEPLQGQTAFPGFEEPAPDAEAIDKAARKISFRMDFMRDPEDALISWGAPADFFSGYLNDRFEKLVQKAAEITGADPEQIRDTTTRTPEQDALLTKIAGRATLDRLDRFRNSLYFDALTSLYDKQPQDAEGNIILGGFELDVIREQAAVYFFALHGTVDPLTAGSIPPAQREELSGIFDRLFAFYEQRAEEIGKDAIKYGATLSAFIRHENPEQSTAEAIEQTAKNYPSVITKHISGLNFPVDKVNSNLWRGLPLTAEEQEEISIEIDTATRKNKRKGHHALINVAVDYSALDGVKIDRELNEYDFRLMTAAGTLIDAGNNITTLSAIHEAMGNTGNPSSDQIEKIMDSLTKQRKTDVSIDSTKENAVNKGYPVYVYSGSVMPFDSIKAFVDGKMTEAAIRFLAPPPLYEFAKGRSQMTTIKQEVLQSPVNKTAANLAIDNYLLERISHMKNNSKLSRKILYSTLYEKCHIETRMQRSRARGKIRTFLDHYKKTDFIKGYKEVEDGIIIRP